MEIISVLMSALANVPFEISFPIRVDRKASLLALRASQCQLDLSDTSMFPMFDVTYNAMDMTSGYVTNSPKKRVFLSAREDLRWRI